VFLVGDSANDLDVLRDRVQDTDWQIVGVSSIDEWRGGAPAIIDGFDVVVLSADAMRALRPTSGRATSGRGTVADSNATEPGDGDRMAPDAPHDTVAEPLTPREHDVLALLADGLSNRAIAEELAISEHTVKFHLASIFGKLGVSSRVEAVRRGLALGLVEI
jgi:DNA-binding NarL/FixJ family response regulator